MKKIWYSAALLAVVTLSACAQEGVPIVAAGYTPAQIKVLTKGAKTKSDYLVLSGYYSQLASTQRLQAEQEKQVWVSRIPNPTHKYPSPVDSAHYLYDSYARSAEDSAAKAQQYRQLAASTLIP